MTDPAKSAPNLYHDSIHSRDTKAENHQLCKSNQLNIMSLI